MTGVVGWTALRASTSGQAERPAAKRDVRWIEGLRGLAAVFVVACHMCWLLDPDLFKTRDNDQTPARLWQLPPLRALISGRAEVAMFFVLTGLSNALGPIKLLQNGDCDNVYRRLARSAGRRLAQLVLPCAAATTLNWLVCQLGIFRFSTRVDSLWIRQLTPDPSPTLFMAVYHLIQNLTTTWTREANYYGNEQWCMTMLLQSSMTVYYVMLATSRCRPLQRMAVISAIIWFWLMRNEVWALNVYGGMLIAELSLLPGTIVTSPGPSVLRSVLAGVFLAAGLYLASYPQELPELSPWSQGLTAAIQWLRPGIDTSRISCSAGAVLVTLGVLMSDKAKQLLSHPFCYRLGELSMGIFLLHMMVFRTVGVWILYSLFGSRLIDEKTGLVDPNALHIIPSKPYRFIAAVITFAVVYGVASLWHSYLEPYFGVVTDRLDKLVCTAVFEPALPVAHPAMALSGTSAPTTSTAEDGLVSIEKAS